MTGRSVGFDASPLSCFLFRPRKSCEKRKKRSHTNVSNASVIRTSRIFQAPLQPPLPCFHQWVKLVLAQSPTKRPTFAFTGESGYTLAFRRRIAHNGLHTETGGVSDGVVSLPSERSARSETSPGRVSERQILPLLGLGRGDSRRTQRACGTVMRLCASLFRRRRGPAGLRDLFLLLPKLRLLRSAHTGPFRVCEAGVVSLPSARFARCRNAGRPLVKVVYLPFSCVPY